MELLPFALGASAYLAGFLAWAAFSNFYGLGFLALTAQQYLAAGIVILALIFGWTFLVDQWDLRIEETVSHAWSRWATRASFHCVAPFVVLVLVLSAVQALRGVTLVRVDIISFSVAIALVALAMDAMLAGIERRASKAPSTRAPQHEEDQRRFLAEARAARRRGRTMLRTPVVAVAFVVLFGALALPHVEPGFGGARPRQAILELDGASLSDSLKHLLLANDTLTAGGTVRTVPVNILFIDGDEVLFRLVGQDLQKGALYSINWATVHSITWLS